MAAPIGSRALEELVDRLLALRERDERERELLRHLVAEGCARSASVWRPLALRGAAPRWHAVRAHGAAALQPTEEQVGAVLAGEVSAGLFADRLVLRLGDGAAALALGGLGDEERLEQAEALAVLVDALDLLPAAADELDAAARPFPGTRSAAPEPGIDAGRERRDAPADEPGGGGGCDRTNGV